ncbi:PE domain-containing protein [Allokutzneria oryzae]|uniref:PE domain-containing protein n=1 Tax=Allokutzneria oryzae TaxID=1378989 RepID=A0ABV6A0D5_9PSEU
MAEKDIAARPAPDPVTAQLLPATSPNGGYQLDEAKLEALIKEWELLFKDLLKARNLARSLEFVKGPGDEEVSTRVARATKESAKAYIRHNNATCEYVASYIKKLKSTLATYRSREKFTAGQIEETQR